MEQFGTHMTWIDWSMIAFMLLFTTYIGHRLRGDTSNLSGFFLGSRNVPWWAVSGSLIATRTSALIFIAVPATVFMMGGDFTFMQAVLGFVLGDILMGLFLITKFYKEEIYSPYDYIKNQLGERESQLSRGLWMVGAVLSQSVRLLATALVLSVITGLPIFTCILIMGVFSVIWSIMGGITTVIWTDVIQLCIFLVGAIFAIFWALGGIPGGIEQVLSLGMEYDKLRVIDLSLDPKVTYTLWVGLIGATVFELGQLSTDQIFVQRVLCCRSPEDAQKSLYFSTLGNITTPIMLFVGLCLFAFYQIQPPPESVSAVLSEDPDRVFPYFLASEIPTGISGLIIASIFAAGISTLDSALTAVTESSVNAVYKQFIKPDATEKHYMFVSKLSVVIWGFIFIGVAWGLYLIQTEGLLALGLAVYGYVYGALLGIAVLAFIGKGSWPGIVAGCITSITAVIVMKIIGVAFFWWYPVGTLVMLLTAWLVTVLVNKVK